METTTLVGVLATATLGAWLGASVVTRLPRRRMRLVMGTALAVAGLSMAASVAGVVPGLGTALGLHGWRLALGLAGNGLLGALMTAGIGLYAPCMILVYLLGMHPTAAFPIMMGSCALLMPVASARFPREGKVDRSLAAGLTLGGVPAVLFAALVVRSLPLDAVRVLVVLVVGYTAVGLLRAAREPDPVTARA